MYCVRKLPDGSWSPAQNLGPEINTEADEDFPNISHDGKTLYFSSNGRSSMGGFDIFKAIWDEENVKWVNVKNIGYPLNTTDDDMNLRLSSNGRHGYIAAVRDGGFGDLDIYRLDFNNIDANLSMISGKISSADSVTKKISYADIFITVTDNSTKDVFGNYVPNPHSGKYVIILPSGDYTMSIEHPGFQTYEEKINVAEKVSIRQEITKNIIIYPNEMQKSKTIVDPKNVNVKKAK